MSMSKMNDSEKEWLKNFNYSMRGDKQAFKKICNDKDKFEVIFSDINAYRQRNQKDVMGTHKRVGTFVADLDYTIQKHEISKTWAESKKSNYTREDYTMNTGLNTIEQAMVEFLDNKQIEKKRTRLSSVKELTLGTEVKIWIEEHVYDKEIGTVIAMRPNGQYLIEITSRKAHKRNGRDTGLTAQMWVFPNEIRIYP